MTSIFSRLRSYAESQSSRRSAQSAQPPPTTSTTVTTPTHDDQAIRKQSITESPEFADTTRKICPDLDLFPQDFETEPTAIHRGLPPPIRRGISTSSKLPTPSTRPAEYTDAKSPLAPPATGDSVSPKASPSSSSSGNTPPGGRGFIDRLGNWSTFGRRRAPPPSLNEFGEQTFPSPSAWRRGRASSRRSSRPSSKTTSTHSSPNENKENAPRVSSQSSLGRRTPAAAAARQSSSQQETTRAANELGFDSPPTLGKPSQEVIVHDIPPPMPPLDHPALLYSREKTTTYPPRARAKGTKDDDGVAPDQFTFGRALRPHRSLPRVQQLFGTRPNKGGDEGNEQGDNAFAADDSAGDKGGVPVPTIGLGCITRPINDLTLSLSPPTQTFPSSLSSSSNLISPSASVGPVDAYDPIASNLYDLNISLSGNAVRMQQNAPRVRDKKPLRSSLKASARPTPIASTSSSNPSALMPSISLVAGGATASDGVSPQTPVSSPGRSETARGKRKAEDVDITPPDSKKATFAVPASPRDQTSALAPSSYHDNKRARLSGPSPSPAPPNSNAQNIGTYSSLASSRAPSRTRAPSSTRSATAGGGGLPDNTSERERRGSLSQRSIPISALVTPQVPSVGRTSSAYHMRDPRRPPRRMETSWALRFRTADDAGSPVQSWLFYLALVLFPLWWIGAVWRVPKTRVVGGTDTEKAVPLDDPQIEFDARSWRFRCRVMAVISLFTYVPFIVCIAVFGGR